jgi:hypothetical protein
MSESKTIGCLISICALALLTVRLVWPRLQIDAITVGLLIVAILPWISRFLESAKFPGGWEIVFGRLEKNLKEATENIHSEIAKNAQNIAAIGYELGPPADARPAEQIIYSGVDREVGFDFSGRGGRIYTRVDGKDMPITPEGKGNLSFDHGLLNIERFDTEGRYEISLLAYNIGGTVKDVIPQTDASLSKRRIRLSCEARAVGGEHTLKFVLKGQQTGKWLAVDEKRLSGDEWVTLNAYFLVDVTEACRLRIDDQDVSRAPSSVQVRNIVLAEKST